MRSKPKPSEEKVVKTTLRVPQSVWTAARIRGLQEGIPVQDVVVKALQAYLKGGL